MDNPAVLAIGIFVFVVLAIGLPYYLFVVRAEGAARDMIQQRIRTGGAAIAKRRVAGLLKDVEQLSVIGPLNTLLGSRSKIAGNLRGVIQLSGFRVTPGQVVLGSACLVLFVYLAVAEWTSTSWIGLVAGAVVGTIPYAVLRFLRARRLGKFEEQFPEAVDLIARTLRAGHAFTTGLRLASEELPEPVAGEFRLLHDQQNYGLPLTDGLRALADRVPLIDARFFVTAVLTQREAGGNLAEVLDNLSAVIRERFRIKRQLRVITAHGRMTGIVLASLPPALAVYMLIEDPENLHVLTSSTEGIHMILLAIGLQILGAFMIYKISNIDY